MKKPDIRFETAPASISEISTDTTSGTVSDFISETAPETTSDDKEKFYEFCAVIKEEIRLLSENEKNLKLEDGFRMEEKEIIKDSCSYYGLSVINPGSAAALTVDLDYLYEKTENGMSRTQLRAYLKKVLSGKVPDSDSIIRLLSDRDEVKKRLRPRIINEAACSRFLSDKPHRTIEDLCVYYSIVLDLFGDGNGEHAAGFTAVTKQMASILELTEEELYAAAVSNMENEDGLNICPLEKVLTKLTGSVNTVFDYEEETASYSREYPLVFVITNKSGFYGAAGILSRNLMKSVCKALNGDCFIIPSSVHELLAVPEAGNNAQNLERLVCQVNEEVVEPGERLSNHVYLYRKADGSFVIP